MSVRQVWRRYRNAGALLFTIAATIPASACLSVDSSNNNPSNPATDSYSPLLGINIDSMTKVSDDLYYQDVVVGTGADVALGDSVSATYTGYLTSAAEFDSNVGGSPYGVRLGAHAVIPGWEIGIPGMRVGGKRRLVIGSNLAYGPYGYGAIPPNATIVFDVTIVGAP